MAPCAARSTRSLGVFSLKSRSLIVACIVVVVTVLVGYFLYSSPDVSFRSSDGVWQDGEVQFKGRTFEAVVIYFEGYKLRCATPSATIVRTTPVNWANVFAWPSYWTDKKWKVPWGPKIQLVSDPAPCTLGGWAPGVLELAELNAKRYLENL